MTPQTPSADMVVRGVDESTEDLAIDSYFINYLT